MTPTIEIGRDVARRFLALRHLLAPPRSLPGEPASVMSVVERLGSLQFDPLEVAGRNHDLVLLARIAGYRREMTDRLLYQDRVLYETYNKGLSLVPTAELPWYRITWDLNRVEHDNGAFGDHAPLVEELLERIRSRGPMSSTDVEPRAAIDWYWRPTNQVRALLEALAEAGILGLARREGNRRVYDLAERLFPPELLTIQRDFHDQRRHKLLSRFRAHGLLGRGGGQAELWLGLGRAIRDPAHPERPTRPELMAELEEDGTLLSVAIHGLRGDRLMLAADLPILESAEAEVAAGATPGGAAPGVVFLAPLDPLVWDRDFLRRCFDFDYIWEVYVPAAKRRWGYYVLPIFYGDRFVGRIEPRIDRRGNALRILDIWWEPDFDPMAGSGFAAAFAAAIDAHRGFGGVRKVTWPRTARLRPFVAAVKARLGQGG